MVSILDVVHDAARIIDRSPISPMNTGNRVKNYFFDRRDRRAAADPTWAQIEARREFDNGRTTLLSDDLSWADLHTQNEIAERITPFTIVEKVALKAASFRLTEPVAWVQDFVHRGRYGWAVTDTFSMGSILAKRTGEQLLYMAEHAHGWPGGQYESYEDWVAILRHHGQILATDGGREQAQAEIENWYELAIDPAVGKEVEQEAFRQHQQIDREADEKMTESMHWVAQNWQTLWD